MDAMTSGGWTVDQWLAWFEQNIEAHTQQLISAAQQASPSGDAAWGEVRGRYGVAADPLLARWVASLDPSRPRGASAEELRQVLEGLAAWGKRELMAFERQAPAAASHPVFQRLQGRLGRLPIDEIVRYREGLAAQRAQQPPPGAAPSVGGIFANAAKTAGETPWASAYQQGAQTHTLVCPYCGGVQERPLDFICRYCKKPLG